jgi:hypothetical protein
MKTYKAKSSVARAAKKEFGTDWKTIGQPMMDEMTGLYYFQPYAIRETEEITTEQIEKVIDKIIPETVETPVETYVAFGNHYQVVLPAPKVRKSVAKADLRGKSAIGSPCRIVWDIAGEMEGARRKDIIQACVEAGVAYYTARTQYQKYREAMKNSAVPATPPES